jgi:hypothetical protein
MKIAAIMVFKNEVDALPYWLNYMDSYVDYFLFRDNESTDGSGDVVRNHPKTVYYDNAIGKFVTSMKDVLYEECQNFIGDDDWICDSAPDVYPFFDVRNVIANANKKGYNSIKTYYPTFFFTKEMYKRYTKDTEYKNRMDNFDVKNYEYYANVSNYVESMFKNVKDKEGNRIRYTKEKQEPPIVPNMISMKTNLCFGHYRFRTPSQMIERFRVRSQVNPNHTSSESFVHYPTWNWKRYLVSESKLYRYNGSFNTKRVQFTDIVGKGE